MSHCQPEESTVIPTARVSGIEGEVEDYEGEEESQASKANDKWVKLRLVFKEDDFESVTQVRHGLKINMNGVLGRRVH